MSFIPCALFLVHLCSCFLLLRSFVWVRTGLFLCAGMSGRGFWECFVGALFVGVSGCLFWATWILGVRTCGIVVFSGMGYGSAMYIQGGARILTVLSHCGFRWRVGLGCPGIILLSAFCLWAGLSSCWGTAVKGVCRFPFTYCVGWDPSLERVFLSGLSTRFV